tara:strand:+ start:18 stop:1049 length:1032 start_codon:yes stop_codon:yes gene_type:complete
MKKLFSILTLILLLPTLAFAGGAVLKNHVKAGFVYVGPVGDHGWTYMHDQGRQMVEDELGDKVSTVYVESVPEGPDAARVMRNMAQSGVDIIFTTSFGYMDQTLKVAKEFPNVKFEHATGYKRSENVSVYSSRFYEGRYIQGVIAGHMSKAGKAGYIASFPIPEVIRGINAFYLGATSVNPDFDLDIIWVNTWYDPAKEAQAAEVLITGGVDIITQHTDSPAPLQTAASKNIYAFGQASDMIAFAPKTQLTSIMDNWGPYYVSRIKALMNGMWESEDTWGGMRTGMVGMAPYTNMPDDIKAIALEIEHAILNGDLNVFDGITNDSGLLGMMNYLDGIDASVPN